MATPSFIFINNPYVLTQNANVYGEYINEGTFDYTFYININSLVPSNPAGITGIFSNAIYKQNDNNIDLFDVNITLPNYTNYTNWNVVYNNQPLYQVLQGNSTLAYGTFKSYQQTLGDKLLEVVAHKLFGHAQARAAINNDDLFYLHDRELWDHLSNSVAQSDFRNDIFCQYVGLGRYNAWAPTSANNASSNDVNGWVNFNFVNLTFDYPLFVSGNILLNSSLTPGEINVLQNGPNVGGTLLVNGAYNIPILVRFHN
jgi:hypothetical protein